MRLLLLVWQAKQLSNTSKGESYQTAERTFPAEERHCIKTRIKIPHIAGRGSHDENSNKTGKLLLFFFLSFSNFYSKTVILSIGRTICI